MHALHIIAPGFFIMGVVVMGIGGYRALAEPQGSPVMINVGTVVLGAVVLLFGWSLLQ